MERHNFRYRSVWRFLMMMGFLVVFVLSGALAAHAAAPSLIVQYNFDGNLEDALGNSALTAFGPENDGYNHNNATSGFDADSDGTYWYWTSTLSRGGGFWIDIDEDMSANYSIGVRFSFNITESGYRKIIDYKNSTSDAGFYFYGGGRLNFYPYGTLGATYISNNQTVDIVSTRAADGTFTAYLVVDGVFQKELEVNDSGDHAIPALVDGKPRFGFFFDENQTGSEATNGGKVYSVRIWNGPISEDQIGSAMNTVAYNGNGHTGGTPPVDPNSYAEEAEVTVLGNSGGLVNDGFVFSGWNTRADGTGTTYLPNATFMMGSAGVTLYAVWEEDSGGEPPAEPTLTVTYDGNGSARGDVPEDPLLYETGDSVTVLGNTGGLSRSRYSFRGWNTAADGSGTRYRAGDTFEMGEEDVVLYAQWRRISTSDNDPAPLTEPEEAPAVEPDADEPAMEEEVPFSAHFFLNRMDYRVVDEEYEMDAVPLVREGRVLLPLRYAAYAVGIAPEQIQWDPERQVVTVDTGQVLLRVVIGSSFMEINGEPIPLEVPAEIVDGRTLLPLRALSEALGYEVLWLEETKEVVIQSFR